MVKIISTINSAITMNITELFEKIQDKFHPDDLNGEYQLQGNCIVWTYNLDEDSEEINTPGGEDEESDYSFNSTTPEELLLAAYGEDFKLLEEFLDEIEEDGKWSFSESETGDYTISFKIF
jgi:hypothetical protein